MTSSPTAVQPVARSGRASIRQEGPRHGHGNDDLTDEQIQREVLEELRWDARGALELGATLPIENLDVNVSKGWITLRGEVEWGTRPVDR